MGRKRKHLNHLHDFFCVFFPREAALKSLKIDTEWSDLTFCLIHLLIAKKKKKFSFRRSQRKVISICRAAYVTQIITETARKGGAGVEVGWMCSRNCRKSKAAEKFVYLRACNSNCLCSVKVHYTVTAEWKSADFKGQWFSFHPVIYGLSHCWTDAVMTSW